MKNTVEIDYEKKTESTKRYDEVGSKVKKLLTASMANFIPELADALREDWYPHLSKEVIQLNATIRSELFHKIVEDYSKERNEEGIWSTKGISNFIPFWLKDPQKIESGKALREAQLAKKYQKKIETQKEVFEMVKQLPLPPRELEEDLDEVIGGWSKGPSKYQKLGEDTKSSLTKMGDIRDGCRILWTALTEKEHMPHPNEDLLIDHIKPTREYRKFVYELDEDEQIGLHNWLTYTEAAIEDMLEILEKARK